MCAGGGSQMRPTQCPQAIYLIDALMRWLGGLKTSIFNVINLNGKGAYLFEPIVFTEYVFMNIYWT